MLLNTAEIREALATLKNAKAKPVVDNKYIAIIAPNTTRDLQADSNLLNAWQYAANRGPGNPLFALGDFDYLGVRFVETTNAKVGSSLGMSGADVYYTMFLGKEAYAVTELSSQQARTYVIPRETPDKTDPLFQHATVGYKAAMACCRLNEAFMVRVEHVTTAHMAA